MSENKRRGIAVKNGDLVGAGSKLRLEPKNIREAAPAKPRSSNSSLSEWCTVVPPAKNGYAHATSRSDLWKKNAPSPFTLILGPPSAGAIASASRNSQRDNTVMRGMGRRFGCKTPGLFVSRQGMARRFGVQWQMPTTSPKLAYCVVVRRRRKTYPPFCLGTTHPRTYIECRPVGNDLESDVKRGVKPSDVNASRFSSYCVGEE